MKKFLATVGVFVEPNLDSLIFEKNLQGIFETFSEVPAFSLFLLKSLHSFT